MLVRWHNTKDEDFMTAAPSIFNADTITINNYSTRNGPNGTWRARYSLVSNFLHYWSISFRDLVHNISPPICSRLTTHLHNTGS